MIKLDDSKYYLWVGGSCDYGHVERSGAGAFLLQKGSGIIDTYVESEFGTTEFRMMLKVILVALDRIPPMSDIVILTNVAYLQNFDRTPDSKASNPDLILKCIDAKNGHKSVSVKIVPYHKHPELIKTHEMAHSAMDKLRRGSR